MELLIIIKLTLIGLFAGLVGGMLGVGGSIVMIPAMTEVLGPDQHLYQAAAMIVNFFVVVPAVYQHRRAKALDVATVCRIIPLAILAVLAGVGLSELPLFAGPGEAYLRALFGAFLLCIAAPDLYRLLRARIAAEHLPRDAASPTVVRRVNWKSAAAIAIPTGLVAGLLGVGGGILAVPLQRRLLHLPMRNAIANSATIIIATSCVGAIAKNYAYAVDHEAVFRPITLAVVLIPTAILGSLVGSRFTHRAPPTLLKAAFYVLLIVAAVRLTLGAGRSLTSPEASARRVEALQRNRFSCSGSSPTEHVSVQGNPRGLKSAARYTKSDSVLVLIESTIPQSDPPLTRPGTRAQLF